MAKKKFQVKMDSFGLYTPWDRASKQLPQIREFTTTVPACVDVEFGYILNIKSGKGKKLSFIIDHPPFPDESGKVSPPFKGELYVRSNDYNFFLGDTIWLPVEDKVGKWRIVCYCDGAIISDKTFDIVL